MLGDPSQQFRVVIPQIFSLMAEQILISQATAYNDDLR
jgi:hypothetical protein